MKGSSQGYFIGISIIRGHSHVRLPGIKRGLLVSTHEYWSNISAVYLRATTLAVCRTHYVLAGSGFVVYSLYSCRPGVVL